MKKLIERFELPHWIQFCQVASLAVYIAMGSLVLGLSRPPKFFQAVLAATLLDFLFNLLPWRQRTPGKIRVPLTGMTAGITTSLLLETPRVEVALFAVFVAISSKTLLQVNGRHVLNPANLGIISALMLFPQDCTAQSAPWNGPIWVLGLMGCMGLLLSTLAGRAWISVTYLAGFAALSLLHSATAGLPPLFLVGSLIGLPAIPFAFHMITDPATTPTQPGKQVAMGLLIAAVDLTLRTQRILHSSLLALLLVTAAWPALNLWILPVLASKRARGSEITPSPGA